MKGQSMSYKEIGLLVAGLILIQGMIAIFLSYGINGSYFKNAQSYAEGLRKLRAEKPLTAKIIGVCYLMCLIELAVAFVHGSGRR
jgi:hypothetical protein